jgi:hydroxymethylbilane synthase
VTAERVRIGTRGSELALWQARWVQSQLAKRRPGLDVVIEIIRTKGDKIIDSPLSTIGDKGLFTREIEQALLRRDIDLAVHSLKDLPTQLPAGLIIGAVSEREDVRDVFIPHPENEIRDLLGQSAGARIATGSLRRRCQLLNLRKDFSVVDIRGNLNTRMRKLEESDWAGMILARAGVVRLGMFERAGETLSAELFLPAVGQGALGVEIREEDSRVQAIVGELNHEPTLCSTAAERALLRRLEGGCQIPIGAYARVEAADRVEDGLILDALVGSLDGNTVIRNRTEGSPEEAEQLGVALAESLLRAGADRILRDIRSDAGSTHEPAG